MSCQRDQIAAGKGHPRSCMDCGVGPCKKYDRYEYPAGFPEEMKRRLEGIKPSDGVTSSLTESALVRAYREAVIHETKLEAEVQRLQKSERNMDHKVTQLVAEAEAKRLSRGYVDAERRVNVTHEVTQLRAELEDAKILKLAREEEVARANGRHRSPLFQTGHFNLHSGGSSNWKIECDAFSQSDWKTIAVMILERCGPFSSVVGVPRGGLPLAEALKPYASATGPRLIVDDVLTTGNSILEVMRSDFAPCIGWVVFARGQCPRGVNALFQMGTDKIDTSDIPEVAESGSRKQRW